MDRTLLTLEMTAISVVKKKNVFFFLILYIIWSVVHQTKIPGAPLTGETNTVKDIMMYDCFLQVI